MTDGAQPGTVISGRYELRELLGEGGFGRVWKAHDTLLGVDVAVKQVLLNGRVTEEERALLLARAGREARHTARLRDHPNIVTVYDVVEVEGVPWIVMRLVEGHSLADELKAGGTLPVERVGAVAAALLRALGAAHEADVAHRDVKPANVLLATGGEVLLADFGIAVGHTDHRLTASSLLIGSPAYMAPERWQGTEADGRADLFSLGVTLYEAVEGVPPFPVGNIAATLTEPPRPPEKAGPLGPLLVDLLEKDPARRPDVATALAALAAAREPAAKKTAPPRATAPQAQEPPERTKVLRDPVTVTARRGLLVGIYTYMIGGAGCLAGILGGYLVSEFADVSDPGVKGWILWVAVTLVSLLAGLVRGATVPLDRVTVDGDGLSVTQWLVTKHGSGLAGTVESTYAIRWDALERVTVEEVAKGYYRVFAWFPRGEEPPKEWLKEHGITRRKDRGHRVYPRLRDNRMNLIDRKLLREPIRLFAGDLYEETPPFSG
ncbi:serine/threonine-protein kinase [Streptomyces sp. NPDC048172]|uniref:serine/threonine-protein kinase n=1 Tax=Streptomyces sp. NPDC048172 TaxID=3365505 RepID=UPI00371A9740